MALGSPAASGQPMFAIAHPLGNADGRWARCASTARAAIRIVTCASCTTSAPAWERPSSRIEQSEHWPPPARSRADRDRAARDEARAANAAKDTFLAMLGHELRNPLAPIIAAAELLRRDASGPALAHVEIIERQARHLDRLVGDLLDVSRVTTGKVNLRRSAVDLRDVASKAAEMARPPMLAKGQHLTMDLPHSPAMVDGDEARLAQVASNLLNNASAYSPRWRTHRLAGACRPQRGHPGSPRPRYRHRTRHAEQHLRAVRSGSPQPGVGAQRLWGWGSASRARWWSCTAAASRPRARAKAAAACSGWPCHDCLPARQTARLRIPSAASQRRRPPRQAREGSCWSTTTWMPPTRWASC